MKRGGKITAKNQSLTVAFGDAPAVTIPSRNYYGRRQDSDLVVSGGGATWSQRTGVGTDSLRAVVRRSNNLVQVGNAPAFTVTGGVGLPNRQGLIATYQNGCLVNRGSVLIPPDKFLATNGVDSGDFITINTAALMPLVETEVVVVVPGAGTDYYTEDGVLHTVPIGALSAIVLVPKGVPVVRMAAPVATLGRVVVPTTASIQSLLSPTTYTFYELSGSIVAINNGSTGVLQ